MRFLRAHIHKKLIIRLRLFLIIFIIMLGVLGYEVFKGYANAWTVLLAISGSLGIGFLASRRMKLQWDAEAAKVVKRVDMAGVLVLSLYVIFAFTRKTVLANWFQGRELSVVLLAVAAGVMLGRLLGMRWRIKKVLRKENIIPLHPNNNIMTIQRDGLDLHYIEKGSGDITLLFIHGAFIDHTYWQAQLDLFSEKYHVVALDLAGHGKSGQNRSNWTIEAFGEDVIKVMQDLHLQNVIIIGHSMGADIMLEAAVGNPEPVIGCIAVDYFKMAGTEMPAEFQAQVPGILQNMRDDFANTSEWYARQALVTPETDPAIVNRVVQDYRQAYPPMGVSSLESVFNYWQRQGDLLQQLPFKLYLIQCDYYPTNEAALQACVKSGYEITYIHVTSHYPMIENPDDFNRLLQQLLYKIAHEVNNMQ